ncbi:hypothetical protein VKT23_003830 [Stygiomarasmius scandens]|uniref:Uncharacterized protein n=1 Tax=Marasmiellus scandens TaxID=2682957 RepID=A0ABR1JYG2_9AGAR
MTISTTQPTDEQVINALNEIRNTSPALGRPKILARLRAENNWTLSDARLKRFINCQEATQHVTQEDLHELYEPTATELVAALERLRQTDPNIGRPKVLARLQMEYRWSLSDKRLKKCMQSCYGDPSCLPALSAKKPQARLEEKGTKNPVVISPIAALTKLFNSSDAMYEELPENFKPRIPEEDDLDSGRDDDTNNSLAPLSLPDDPYAAQMNYAKGSRRMVILYGRGKWNYGVSPNADVSFYIQIAHSRIEERLSQGPLSTLEEKLQFARTPAVLTLWEVYEVAARKAGISRADVGRQFEAEFGVDMSRYLPSRQECSDPEMKSRLEDWENRRRSSWREGKQPLMEAMNVGRPWDDNVHGQFALLVTKINRKTGKECGYVQ